MVIPDSVTEIRGFAFAGCTGLTSVVIPNRPNRVTTIGRRAFRGCSNLKFIVIDAEDDEFERVKGLLPDNLRSMVIPTNKYNQIKAVQGKACQPYLAERAPGLPADIWGVVGGLGGIPAEMQQVMNTVPLPNPTKEGWRESYRKMLSEALSSTELLAAVSPSARTTIPKVRETKSQGSSMTTRVVDEGDREQWSSAATSSAVFWSSDETGVSNSHLDTSLYEHSCCIS